MSNTRNDNPHVQKVIEGVPLDAIDTESFTNHRSVIKGTESLAHSIFDNGLLDKVHVWLGNDTEIDEDGYPVITDDTQFILIAGFRRIDAIKKLRTAVQEHNERVAAGFNFEEELPDADKATYIFASRSEDGEIIEFMGEVEFPLDEIDVNAHICNLEQAIATNGIENHHRQAPSGYDTMKMVAHACGLPGNTQVLVGRRYGVAQPYVSNLVRANNNCIPAVHEALKEDKITVATAIKLSKYTNKDGSPNKREQQKLLDQVLSGDKKAANVRTSKARSQKEQFEMMRQLDSEDAFVDVDPLLREGAVRYGLWVLGALQDEDLFSTSMDDVSIGDHVPEKPAPKPKAEKKPRASAKKKAAPKKKAPAKKAAASDEGGEAEGGEEKAAGTTRKRKLIKKTA